MEAFSFEKEFSSASSFTVVGQTTGYCGGDAGHGGFLKISLIPGVSYAGRLEVTDFQKPGEVVLFDGYERYRFDFLALGDCEIEQLHEALKFLVSSLDKLLK